VSASTAFAETASILMTLPSGGRTKNRRTPHGSEVIGRTIS